MADTGDTIICNNTSFKGDIASEGAMRIDGKFEGKISAKGKLTVGSTADVHAEVDAAHVAIEGGFKGTLTARDRVELTATAKVHGDIRSVKLVVAEGATLIGNVQVPPDARQGVSGAPPVPPAVPPAVTPTHARYR
jgi:cytoskeletal protein CcmA (bactofilin family)